MFLNFLFDKLRVQGPFLEGPEKFSHPGRHSKISNIMTAELFYSQGN